MANPIPLFPEVPAAQQDRFDEFWQHYPKRVGKPLAKAKWDAITGPGLDTKTLDKDSGVYVPIRLQATAEEIIEGVKRYCRSQIDPNTYKLKHGGQYTLHPATFLNQGRWLDEM